MGILSDNTAIHKEARRMREWILSTLDSQSKGKSIASHLAGFDTPEKLETWLDTFQTAIVQNVPDFRQSVGLDFGCWSGFGSWLLSRCGPKKLYAVDINREFMEFAQLWATEFDLQKLSFICNERAVIPLLSESIDWVYVNQVFCNMNPIHFDISIREIARVLKPGGTLILCDSNNPYSSDTLRRLHEAYRQRELGDGTHANPNGPLFKSRCKVIKDTAPALDDETVRRLARNTCYQWGRGLEQLIHGYLENGAYPTSPFRPGLEAPPQEPRHGGATGNITDPFWFLSRFQEQGLSGCITSSPRVRPKDNVDLLNKLRQSQTFYIFGQKTRCASRMFFSSGEELPARELPKRTLLNGFPRRVRRKVAALQRSFSRTAVRLWHTRADKVG